MSRGNLAFAVAAFAGAILLFFAGLYRPHLFAEDRLIENLTAFSFAATSLLALSAALAKPDSSANRPILFATSGLSLILFLSEISFGARIFHIQMPQMSGGGQFDGGHDIIILLLRQLRGAGSTSLIMAAIGGALFLAAAAALLHLFRPQVQAVIEYVLQETLPFRLVLALGMLAGAETLDLVTSFKASILEEALEFSASVVLILAVLGSLRRQPLASAVLHDQDQIPAGVRPGYVPEPIIVPNGFGRIAAPDKDVPERSLLEDSDVAREGVSRAE